MSDSLQFVTLDREIKPICDAINCHIETETVVDVVMVSNNTRREENVGCFSFRI